MAGAGIRAMVEVPVALGVTGMRYYCKIAGLETLVAVVLKLMVRLVVVVVVVDGLRDVIVVTALVVNGAEVIATVATDLLIVTV